MDHVVSKWVNEKLIRCVSLFSGQPFFIWFTDHSQHRVRFRHTHNNDDPPKTNAASIEVDACVPNNIVAVTIIISRSLLVLNISLASGQDNGRSSNGRRNNYSSNSRSSNCSCNCSRRVGAVDINFAYSIKKPVSFDHSSRFSLSSSSSSSSSACTHFG
jgi:hypothetical protein